MHRSTFERHLAAWLRSFYAHHKCSYVCHSTPRTSCGCTAAVILCHHIGLYVCHATPGTSCGCMAAVNLCTPHMPLRVSLCFLHLIWLHGCCHPVHTTNVLTCILFLEQTWALSRAYPMLLLAPCIHLGLHLVRTLAQCSGRPQLTGLCLSHTLDCWSARPQPM